MQCKSIDWFLCGGEHWVLMGYHNHEHPKSFRRPSSNVFADFNIFGAVFVNLLSKMYVENTPISLDKSLSKKPKFTHISTA